MRESGRSHTFQRITGKTPSTRCHRTDEPHSLGRPDIRQTISTLPVGGLASTTREHLRPCLVAFPTA